VIITGRAVPAVSSSLTGFVTGHLDVLAGLRGPAPAGAVPAGLLEALAEVPDPRDPRRVRYGLVPVLAVAVSPVLADARTYAAIAEWARDAPAGPAGPAGAP
jgi:DDE_Tnp_1-associated